MDKEIKNAFNSINIPEDLDNRILKNVISQKKFKNKHKNSYLKFAIYLIIFTLLFGVGVVVAKEIERKNRLVQKNYTAGENTITGVTLDEPVIVNVKSNISCDENITVGDLESELGVDILFDEKTELKSCTINRNDKNEIEEVSFSIIGYEYKFDDMRLSTTVINGYFVTQAASEEVMKKASENANGVIISNTPLENKNFRLAKYFSDKFNEEIYFLEKKSRFRFYGQV